MLLFLVLLAAAPPEGPAPPALHGRWRVTDEKVEGVTTPADRFADLRIEIDGTTFRLRDGDAVLECKIGVEANTRSLVLTPRTGHRADRPYYGLYTISGEQMRICLHQKPNLEPKNFLMDASAGSGCVLISLTRER